MLNIKAIALGTSVACVLSVPMAAAQFGSGRAPRNGACFYRDADYRGDYFCVEAGEDVSSMPSGANDRVSSIRVYGNAEVTVYKDPTFRGDSRRFTSDVRDLDDERFNDVISSIQVQRDRGRDRASDDRRFRRGADVDAVVRRAYQDILEREPDAAGLRTYRSHIIDDDWTEQDVREALRNSPEYRQKRVMTRDKAEDIVRRAYLAVFQREPDSGSISYVNSVMRNNWTQQDVERELRRSPEYRQRGGR